MRKFSLDGLTKLRWLEFLTVLMLSKYSRRPHKHFWDSSERIHEKYVKYLAFTYWILYSIQHRIKLFLCTKKKNRMSHHRSQNYFSLIEIKCYFRNNNYDQLLIKANKYILVDNHKNTNKNLLFINPCQYFTETTTMRHQHKQDYLIFVGLSMFWCFFCC